MKVIHRETVSLLHQQASEILESFAEAAVQSSGDFGKVEEAAHVAFIELRNVLMSAGLTLSSEESHRTHHCPCCNEALHGWALPVRRVVTSEGEAAYRPFRYRCLACGDDHYPLEEANGLSGSQFTTGAKGLISEAAAQTPFGHVTRWLLAERGIPVSAKEVDRTAREVACWRAQEEERLKAAVFGEEAAHLRAEGEDPLNVVPALHKFSEWTEKSPAQISVDGAMIRSPKKGADGSLEWFEHRAGLIAPARRKDPGKTAYVGAVCSADELFDCLAATWRKGGHSQRMSVFVADGAKWIWDRVGLYFPDALQVLDVYHAAEHVASAANACWGEGTKEALDWRKRARGMLMEPGGPDAILRTLLSALKKPEQVADIKALTREVRYLFGHRHRMHYHALKQQDLPIGSGAMESAIKQLNTQRLKQPGMKWTREGADAVLRIRAAHLSGSFQQTVQRRHATLRAAAQRYQGVATPVAA